METYNGYVSLPNAKKLATNQPNYKTFSGNIVQINRALSLIQYKVPGPSKPYFNSMSLPNMLYKDTFESIVVTVNDRGNSGAASVYSSMKAPQKYGGAPIGNRAIFDFAVMVVSNNNAPVVTGLPSYTLAEDGVFKPPGINVVDVDAADVISGRTEPVNGAEMKMTLSCKHGVIRIPAALVPQLTVTWPIARPCLSACTPDYRPFPAAGPTMLQFKSFSKKCVECQTVEGSASAALLGESRLEIYGKLSAQKELLQNMTYQGQSGYNQNNPERFAPYGANGCKRTVPPGESPTSMEAITVVAEDLSNAGCANSESLKHELKLPVIVTPVNSDPQLFLTKEGVDICTLCNMYGECNSDCPRKNTPTIVAFEGDVIAFNTSYGLQVRTYTHIHMCTHIQTDSMACRFLHTHSYTYVHTHIDR